MASDPTELEETSPSSGWGLQKLEEVGMVKVQTAPALASAPSAQPLPSLPARVQPHLHLASVEVRATTPFLA